MNYLTDLMNYASIALNFSMRSCTLWLILWEEYNCFVA